MKLPATIYLKRAANGGVSGVLMLNNTPYQISEWARSGDMVRFKYEVPEDPLWNEYAATVDDGAKLLEGG